MKLATIRSLVVLVLLGLLLLPHSALAQSADIFTIPAGDISKTQFLDALFGPLTGANNISPLTSIVKILNTAILFLGGVFAAYVIVAGTMQTAHDGEVLGKRWSTMWIPIRTAIGAAAVMPVVGGGWCAAQVVVIWLASMGIGAADAAWSAYIQNDPMTGAQYQAPGMSAQIYGVYADMLADNVCAAAFARHNGQDIADGAGYGTGTLATAPDDAYAGWPNSFGPGDVVLDGYSYGQKSESANAQASCGKIFLATPNGAASDTPVNMSGPASASILLNQKRLFSDMYPVVAAQMKSAQGQLWKEAVSMVSNSGAAPTSAQISTLLTGLTNSYTAAMSAAADKAWAAQSANSAYKQALTKDGWIMAGAYYMNIATAQNAITQAVSTIPSSSSPWLITAGQNGDQRSVWKLTGMNLIRRMRGNDTAPDDVTSQIATAVANITAARTNQAGSSMETITLSPSDPASQASTTERLVSAFSSGSGSLFAIIDDEGSQGASATNALNENPIIMAKGLGDAMINWAWTSFGVVTTASFLSVLPGVGGFVTMAAGPFTMLFGVLIVAGATMAYFLPLLPYILWIGVVFGWMVLLGEAVIAAPLWAVMHMAPGGDDFMGSARSGYMLVLSLTVRPLLMIMGLVLAITIMKPVGFLVNSTFAGAFMMSQGPGAGALVGMIAGCVIYASVMLILINRIFALIHIVPDRPLRWFGGQGGELGQEAREFESGSGAKVFAATQAMKGLGEQAQRTLSSAGDAGKQRLAKKFSGKAGKDGLRAQEIGEIGDQAGRKSSGSDNAQSVAAVNPESASAQSGARSAAIAMKSANLEAAVKQAGIAKTPEGKAFVKAYEAAEKSGAANWKDDFIASKAAESEAALENSSPSKRPNKSKSIGAFHYSMAAAGLGLERQKNAEQNIANLGSIDALRQAADAGKDKPTDDGKGASTDPNKVASTDSVSPAVDPTGQSSVDPQSGAAHSHRRAPVTIDMVPSQSPGTTSSDTATRIRESEGDAAAADAVAAQPAPSDVASTTRPVSSPNEPVAPTPSASTSTTQNGPTPDAGASTTKAP